MIPPRQQIAEVRREIAMRERVYPGWILRRKMRQGEADEHLARMRAVLETLLELEAAEPPSDLDRMVKNQADLIVGLRTRIADLENRLLTAGEKHGNR